ncbi:MAG: amidohydrolase family protein [Pirellulales bacterium]
MEPIFAIDVHGHYGRYFGAVDDVGNELMSATAEVVADRAAKANILLTIVSPAQALFPRGANDSVSGNIDAARAVDQVPGLLQYVVIDPREPRTFEQADDMLRSPRCVGIKIHPEEHCYPIQDFGRSLFEFAAAREAVILTHSSEQNSLAADFVPLANSYPEVKLILAHIGCGWDGDLTHQVRAVQRSIHGNIWTDTSSVRSVTPGLIEWAVREIGAERVLFGTDTPLYHSGMQRARIDQSELSEHEKKLVLRDNAIRLFNLGRFLARCDRTRQPLRGWG